MKKILTNMPGVNEGEGKTFDTNKLRSRDLKATLLSLGYGVTRVDGSYIEYKDLSRLQRMAVRAIAKKVLTD